MGFGGFQGFGGAPQQDPQQQDPQQQALSQQQATPQQQQQPDPAINPHVDQNTFQPLAGISGYGNGGVEAPQNFWTLLANGANSFQNQRQANVQAQQERNAVLMDRKQKQDAYEQQQAKTQTDALGKAIIANPRLAHDPQYAQLLRNAYAKQGLPPPLNADGSIDINQFKAPISSLDEKTMQFIMQLDPKQRKAILDRYSGVSPEMYTSNAYITAKDQAALIRAQVYGQSEQDRTSIATQRLGLQKELDDAVASNDYAKINLIRSQGDEAQQKALLVAQEVKFYPQKMQNETARLNGYLQHMQSMGGSKSTGFQQIRLMQSSARTADTLYKDAEGNYQKALTAYNAALAQPGVAADSPTISAMKQQLDDYTDRMNQLRDARDSADQYLLSNVPQLNAAGNYVQAAGGGSVNSVTPKTPGKSGVHGEAYVDDSGKTPSAKGYKNGTTGTMPDGTKVTVQDGVFYKRGTQ